MNPKKVVYPLRLDPSWIEALKDVAAARGLAGETPGEVARESLELGLAIHALALPISSDTLSTELQRVKLMPVLLYILRWARDEGLLFVATEGQFQSAGPPAVRPSSSAAQRTMQQATADLAAFDLDE